MNFRLLSRNLYSRSTSLKHCFQNSTRLNSNQFHARRFYAGKPLSSLTESMANGTNARYVEQMHSAWQRDPNSVDVSWRFYFENLEDGVPPGAAFQPSPSLSGGIQAAAAAPMAANDDAVAMSLRAIQLIRAYQVRGHAWAKIDPLELQDRQEQPKELTKEYYGFTDADLDKVINVGGHHESYIKGFLGDGSPHKTLREILQLCQRVYCGPIAYEYMHIDSLEQCNWIRERIEVEQDAKISSKQRIQNWERLAWAHHFEMFLAKKFHDKRFGLDGGESFVLGLKELIDQAAIHNDVKNISIGMAHRGRLNVLANVLRKPLEQIFCEFQGKRFDKGDFSSSGDVKYHLGTSLDRPVHGGGSVHLSLCPNPSHLEAVNPVVEGKTFAKQYYSNDTEKKHSISVLVHGDASFAGQGVVYETIELSTVKTYSTGGTIHVVINNQIGFTTQLDVRVGSYCTDVAKSVGAPIFHVNGDDADAVMRACRIATDFRSRFNTDVVIDIVCYRRKGHNEIDEPMFTQPKMYTKIKKMKSSLQKYTQTLLEEGDATQEQLDAITAKITEELEARFEAAKTYKGTKWDWLDKNWQGIKPPNERSPALNTGVDQSLLDVASKAITELPEGFTPHKNIQKVLTERKEALQSEQSIDWATAELLAYATLAEEGTHVRLSGQDVERGTFSHRHAVLHDQKTFETHKLLAKISKDAAEVTITNSNLSEYAVLGFELGYSMEKPTALVLWEAQFGDFVNAAQVMLDQFISSQEQKWMRQSGITLLLPHGYEGQGPEHSQAYLSRFLAGSDSNPFVQPAADSQAKQCRIQQSNWQVCNVTTPSNFFHVLRRQVHRHFRKPLIVFTPKSLLRHKLCVSPLNEFRGEKYFQQVLPESEPDAIDKPDKIKQLIYCSGKVYYDLLQRRQEQNIKHTAIVRVEQLAPFPFELVQAQGKLYKNAVVSWVSEEPFNHGAYNFVSNHIATALGESRRPRYVGRAPSSAAAAGSASLHKEELAALLEGAFEVSKEHWFASGPTPTTTK